MHINELCACFPIYFLFHIHIQHQRIVITNLYWAIVFGLTVRLVHIILVYPHTLSRARTFSLSVSLSLSFSLSLCLSLSLSPSLTLSLTPSVSLSLSFSLPLSPSFPLTLPLALSRSLSVSRRTISLILSVHTSSIVCIMRCADGNVRGRGDASRVDRSVTRNNIRVTLLIHYCCFMVKVTTGENRTAVVEAEGSLDIGFDGQGQVHGARTIFIWYAQRARRRRRRPSTPRDRLWLRYFHTVAFCITITIIISSTIYVLHGTRCSLNRIDLPWQMIIKKKINK